MEAQFEKLRGVPETTLLKTQGFAETMGEMANEINAAHPFVEGNGRTMRAWIGEMAKARGLKIDWGKISKEAWYEASETGFETGDPAKLGALLSGAIAPMEAKKTKKQDPLETIS